MFPEWMGDGTTLAYFTFACFIATHLILYFIPNKKIRLGLGYVALLMGGAALLTSFHSASSAVNAAKMELASDKLDRAGEEVKRSISATKSLICGLHFIKSDMSPSNFDDIEQMRKTMCDMFTRLEFYAENDWDARRDFTPPNVGLNSINDKVFKQWADELQQVSADHQHALVEVKQLVPQTWLLWTALEPFVISASWSLGLALLVPPRKRRRL